jgi:hypothetical protein
MPTLSPAYIRLESSLHWSPERRRGRRGGSLGQYREAPAGSAATTFSSREIHSPKPASGAASHDLSTAVETRVDNAKIPAQKGLCVV